MVFLDREKKIIKKEFVFSFATRIKILVVLFDEKKTHFALALGANVHFALSMVCDFSFDHVENRLRQFCELFAQIIGEYRLIFFLYFSLS